MMNNSPLVLGLLESILGPGKKDRNTNDYSFHCPFCKHHKPKLVVNVQTGMYNCWTCHPPTKGKSPVSLLRKLEVSYDLIKEMKSYFSSDNTIITDKEKQNISLPKEFVQLSLQRNTLEYRRALSYLKKRNITEEDIVKYNIGYCEEGYYRDRIIVPSYNAFGLLNYFVARSYQKDPHKKYDAPSCKKTEIIGLENFINWKVPVILCEGIFDAIAIKRNAIPIFGKTIPKALMLKLVESDVRTIYLALDKDALKEALDYSEKLLNYGKEVYLLDLQGKDPSDIGFNKMISLLHDAKPLTFSNLYTKKMQLI